MKGLERELNFLRPLTDSKAWDYCVIWKLGDDPSRFIEWMGCCCSGGGDCKVKMERGEDKYNVSLCRDMYFKHPISTMACEALAGYPSFMSLYSGIHGEVVASTQSKWINHVNANWDSNSYPESNGTRVLIPVFGGLIELFAARHIAKDQKIIDYITNSVLKQEAMNSPPGFSSFNESCIDPFLEHNFQNLPSPSHLLGLIPQTQAIYPQYQLPNTYSSFEGSSSGSNPSNEHPSLDSHSGYFLQNGILKQTLGKSSGGLSRKLKNDENLIKQKPELFLDCNKKIAKVTQKSERDNFPSKNLVTERNRRNRIKDGLYTLRSLVPKISKMDKAAILGDAIEFIGELEKEKKRLQDDLKDIEEAERKRSIAELPLKLEALHEGRKHLPPVENNQDSSSFGVKEKFEVQIEVNQIGKREFLIKLLCEQKRGGFRRLMEAIYALGLQVVDANVTTFDGRVLNILKVEANMRDIQPKKLKESLLKLRG